MPERKVVILTFYDTDGDAKGTVRIPFSAEGTVNVPEDMPMCVVIDPPYALDKITIGVEDDADPA